MKKFISLMCLSLTIILAAGSLSGCHKQNEIAVTVEGVEVKTSTYICALIDADLQGRQKVYEEKSKADDFDSSKEIDSNSDNTLSRTINGRTTVSSILLLVFSSCFK